jgi:hypothetical protein
VIKTLACAQIKALHRCGSQHMAFAIGAIQPFEQRGRSLGFEVRSAPFRPNQRSSDN